MSTLRERLSSVRLVAEAATAVHAVLNGTAVTSHPYRVVEAMGGGELGTQALFLAPERRGGIGPGQGGALPVHTQ